METRKIQKTGGSTYIVSLPKEWAEGRLEEGDEVYINFEGDSAHILLHEDSEAKEEVELDYEEPIEALLRKIIAHYLVGYDIIKIKSKRVIRKKEEIERLVREKMIGVEVTGEKSKEINLQNLLKYSDLPTNQVLVRMNSIIKSMYMDVLNSFEESEEEVLKDIIKRENEIDRLYLLGVRQLKGAIRNSEVREKLGMESKLLCLGYRIVLKSMERVGDHLKKIANFLLSSKADVLSREKLEELGKGSLETYEKTMDSMLNYDGKLAEKIIQESKEIGKLSEEIIKNQKGAGKDEFRIIVNSIDRTRKLSRDIAEVVINLSAGELER